jgi:RNA polymerase primary sigma factor
MSVDEPHRSRAAVECPFPEADHREWEQLIALGRQTGVLHADDVAHVLRGVELSGDVIERVRATLAIASISIDEATVEEVDDTPAALARTVLLDDETAERLLARSARKNAPHDNRAAPSGDHVRMYLSEIGRVDLLTPEDERALAQLIEEGQHAAARIDQAAICETVVDPAEQRILLRSVQRGVRAKSELIQANLRLVVSIAKRYSGRGMQLLDLIQEGNLGLMRAVDKYDHTKGFRFSTYATWWIRQAITRSIADQSRTIRIPVHMVEHVNRLRRTGREFTQENGREPTVEELARAMRADPEWIRDLQRIAEDPLSLDSPVGDEDDANLGDFIADPSADRPELAATRAMLVEAVEAVVGELTEREQEIVRMRFGLDGSQIRTLEEVGRELGVTRERIRQIEAKTLNKLRQPQHSQRLQEFLENE